MEDERGDVRIGPPGEGRDIPRTYLRHYRHRPRGEPRPAVTYWSHVNPGAAYATGSRHAAADPGAWRKNAFPQSTHPCSESSRLAGDIQGSKERVGTKSCGKTDENRLGSPVHEGGMRAAHRPHRWPQHESTNHWLDHNAPGPSFRSHALPGLPAKFGQSLPTVPTAPGVLGILAAPSRPPPQTTRRWSDARGDGSMGGGPGNPSRPIQHAW
jgi:hypothetical protein